MSTWLWAVVLALQAHSGASYVVPIQPHLEVFNNLWWRTLAILGAVLELVLMIGFFGPTKLLPIALDFAVLAAVVIERLPVRETL